MSSRYVLVSFTSRHRVRLAPHGSRDDAEGESFRSSGLRTSSPAQHAVEGDAESVLKAMDDFAREHRLYVLACLRLASVCAPSRRRACA